MRRGKFEAPRKRRSGRGKTIALVLSLVLVLGCVAGGTLAWLTAQSETVTNVFTSSDISVELTENETVFKMIPGHTIAKSPRVTVAADSEACWLFVEVTESTDPVLANYIAYAVNTGTETSAEGVTHGGWTRGEGEGEGKNGVPTNVYFRKVSASESEQVFAVLGAGSMTHKELTYAWANDQVLALPTITKEMMEAVDKNPDTEKQPELSFKAYAVQLNRSNDTEFTAAQAWAERPTETTTP